MPHILALDQGTTSSRAILFDERGAIRAVAQKEITQIFPQAGWVEHDPGEIWASQIGVAVEALGRAQVRLRDIAAIGITNQRETTIVWDRETGEPIHNAIVWQDRRTADFCEGLKAAGAAEVIQEKTGLLVDAYFSGSKIRWILDHLAGARAKADAGKLAFGTVDTWLLWKLTGGMCHVTDVSNASRTMLFNIRTLQWDEELLRLVGIPRSMLPDVRSSSEVYGHVVGDLGLDGVPIAGMAGDQQAALFGQMCRQPGMAKNTYGTGCFLLQNIGTTATRSRHKLVTTIAWQVGDRLEYALEGSVFIGGAVVQWVRDGLGLIRTASDIETLAASVPDNGGVYLVPAFAGLGAPLFLLEQMPRVGMITSSRNSGVIHSGIYYMPGSLKAQHCVEGNRLSYEFCQAHDIPHKKTGKFVVATTSEEEIELRRLLERGCANGVEGLELVTATRLAAQEPNIAGRCALWVPSAGIVASEELVKAYARLAVERGANIVTHAKVEAVESGSSASRVRTTRGEIEARVVVNCAGLYADSVAALFGNDSYRIYPVRGEYWEARKARCGLVNGLVYPAPDRDGLSLGVHFTRTLWDTLLIGPNARHVQDKDDYESNREPVESFCARACRLLPQLTPEDLRPSFSGLRPKLVPPGQAGHGDFIVDADQRHPHVIHMVGMDSPGLTAAGSLARRVSAMVADILS